jgi:hypothetical protein
VELDGQAMHVEFAEAPTAVEYVPAPQFVQSAPPVDVLYLPATHAAHGPPFGPVDPALHGAGHKNFTYTNMSMYLNFKCDTLDISVHRSVNKSRGVILHALSLGVWMHGTTHTTLHMLHTLSGAESPTHP